MRVLKYLLTLIPVFLFVQGAASGLEASAAKVDITPPVGTPLNGFGDRLGRDSVAVHDPLWSRCLYVNDGETAVFLVTLDLCYINKGLRARVLELAPEVVPDENIILTATHTHTGHGAMEERMLFRVAAGRYIPEVVEETARKIVQSMNDAYNARKRAAIGFGVTKQTALSENRRIEKGLIDEQIGVLRVDDSDGNAIAVIANFAAHPTMVPEPDHYSFSCDYPGFYYAALESLTNPGCVAMFMNGAEGDQRPANPESKEGWDRIESIGRLLAIRVKEVCNDLVCGDGKLRVAWSTPSLPRTIATMIHPETVLLQSLEVNDLVMDFVPGEPCVAIGLGLRQRALARGYKAQFTVGLANDYLNYFVPRNTYARKDYECSMNFFGPGIEDWLYREFEKLKSRGNPPEEPVNPELPPSETVGDAVRVVLAGTPHNIGFQRGLVFGPVVRNRYEERVVQRVRSGELLPRDSKLNWFPPFIDIAPVALTELGAGSRPLFEGMSESLFAELEGFAAGAEMPFDALWLAHTAHYLETESTRAALFDAPFCTMFAAVGDRAGADGLVIGRNLDWPTPEAAALVEVRPESGRSFVQAGFAWSAGVFTGMNDAGVVIAAERVEMLGAPPPQGAPVEMVLRDVLASSADIEGALERLRAATYLRGYHVLVAGPGAGAPTAAVIEFGDHLRERAPEEGLLLGVLPEAAGIDTETAIRYARVKALLGAERIVSRPEAERVLGDAELSENSRARIWNEATQHSVVFEPLARRAHAAFRDPEGKRGPATTVVLQKGAAHE